MARLDSRGARGWVLGACLLGAACAGPRTALVVAVASDLSIPGEITQVHASVGGAACTGAASCDVSFPLAQSSDLPLSFGIEPGARATGPVELEIAVRDGSGATLVSRSVSTGFVAGETRLLVVHLDRACVGHGACGAGQTCIAGTCASASVDPSSLAPATPGHELDGLRDAGPPSDGGDVDAQASDADAHDAFVPDTSPLDTNPPDTGMLPPASCRGLVASAPSGLAHIDPDGAGSGAAFDAWCENQLDGGGWTLIAKVTGTSTTLGYDGAAWMGTTPFGAVDETPTDALLAPYWSVPVTQLRIGDGSTFFVTNVSGAATTLRAAMDVSGGVPLAATTAEWLSVTGQSPGTAMCVRSAIDATLSTSATTLRVRIGVVGGTTADCSDATFWMGAGASTTTTDSGCTAFTEASGGARVCGPPGQRRARARTLFVYGR